MAKKKRKKNATLSHSFRWWRHFGNWNRSGVGVGGSGLERSLATPPPWPSKWRRRTTRQPPLGKLTDGGGGSPSFSIIAHVLGCQGFFRGCTGPIVLFSQRGRDFRGSPQAANHDPLQFFRKERLIVLGCQGFFRGCQTHSGHRFPFRSTDEIFNDLRRMQDSIRFNRSKWNPNHVRMLGILQRMSDSQSPPFFFFFWIWDEIIRGSSKKSSLSIVPNNNSIVEGCQGFFRGCRTLMGRGAESPQRP